MEYELVFGAYYPLVILLNVTYIIELKYRWVKNKKLENVILSWKGTNKANNFLLIRSLMIFLNLVFPFFIYDVFWLFFLWIGYTVIHIIMDSIIIFLFSKMVK